MIKEAIDRIISLAGVKDGMVTLEDGRTFSRDALKQIKKSHEHKPDPVIFQSLQGFADFVSAADDIQCPKACLHVVSYNSVQHLGPMDTNNDNIRFCFAEARLSQSAFKFGTWMDLEMFVISLQCQFVPSEEVEKILALLGNLATERVKTQKDSGFTQVVQVKVGISLKAEVEVKNPVVLYPFRTFREVDQPPSTCILRLRESERSGIECSLWEADGGAWQREAIKNIGAWLAKALEREIPIYA